MAVLTFSVAKITFVVADIICKVTVITSSLANITFIVPEITFRMVVITSQGHFVVA